MSEFDFDVFLSHNSTDKPAVEELAHRLRREGIHPWLDKWNLIPGEPWQEAIERALQQCSTCAVFIGTSGTGPWQNEEMRAAIDRRVRESRGGFRVIPVLLPGAERDERSRLPAFLVATTWVEFHHNLDDDEAFHLLICGVRGIAPGPTTGQALYIDECPYRGLETFDVQHAPFFSGREALIGWILNQFRRPIKGGKENRFIGIIGPSGSGKSSLTRAGLIARLQNGAIEGSQEWPIAICRPGTDPLESLVMALSVTTELAETPSAALDLISDMKEDSRTLHLAVRHALRKSKPQRRLLLLVDQFEEIFTLCNDESIRQALIDNLVYAIGDVFGQVVIIIALRADFYGKCAFYPQLAAAISEHQVLVGPMTDDELRQAIERPAQLVGCELEPGLVELLCRDVQGEAGGLPLLQHALLELWRLRQGRRLTQAAYKTIGGVKGSLERRAEDVYGHLTPKEKETCRRIFLRLTQPGEGVEDTKRRVVFGELLPAEGEQTTVEAVIAKLTSQDVRLIISESEEGLNGQQYVEVAHEALIRGWFRLREWIERDREGLRIQRRLTDATSEWDSRSRDESFLYRGARLAGTEEWAKSNADDLSELELAFLQASINLREQEFQSAQDARQRELETSRQLTEEAEKRALVQVEAANQLRRRAMLLTGIGFVAVILAIVAFSMYRSANRERQASSAHEQLALAKAELGTNAECSLALAVQAYDIAVQVVNMDLSPFTNELRNILRQSHVNKIIGPFGELEPVTSAEWSPDGTKIAVAGISSSNSIWDASSGQRLLTVPVNNSRNVSWKPDGKTLAFTGLDSVHLFDVKSGKVTETIDIPRQGKRSSVPIPNDYVAWSPDGNNLAIALDTSVPVIWKADNHTYIPLKGHTGAVTNLSWSLDGQFITTASLDRSVWLWNASNGTFIGIIGRYPSNIMDVAWSPEGHWLAVGLDDGKVYISNVQTKKLVNILVGHTNQVFAVAWSPNGRLLASASWDGTIRLWDRFGANILTLTGHTLGIWDLSWSPDGQYLVSASADGTVRLWNVNSTHTASVLEQGKGWMWDAEWSPDGRFIASASDDGTIVLWDVEIRKAIKRLVGHTREVTRAVWSPDGKFLATTSFDGTVRIWDTSTGNQNLILEDQKNLTDVAWSPDGQTLATTSIDGAVQLWNSVTGAKSLNLQGAQSSSVAWSPNGKYLAFTPLDGTIRFVNIASRQLNSIELKGHKVKPIWGLAWSPDGALIASASDDKTAKIWDVKTGQNLATLSGHNQEVKGIAWSPDGKMVATASLDMSIRVWDVKTGKNLSILQGHTSGVRRISWEPNGKRLLSAGEDGTVRWFQANNEEILRAAREQVKQGLTGAESKVCFAQIEKPGLGN